MRGFLKGIDTQVKRDQTGHSVAETALTVVDSSGWLAYFADEPGARDFAGAVEDTES